MTIAKKNDMGKDPLLKLITKMSVPTMLSMFINALYNIADSVFVSQLSDEALTAISLALPIQTLTSAIAFGTGIGVNSLIARKLGEKKPDEVNDAAKHGIMLGIVSFIPFLIFGLFFTRIYFQFSTSDADIIDLGMQYTRCYCIFSFGIIIQCIIERILQATGNVIYPMIFRIASVLINIILDPILIFGLFGFPRMGIFGAALTTVVAEIISMIFSILVLIKKCKDINIDFEKFRLKKNVIKEIYSIGIPSIIMQSITAFMVTILNIILMNLSEVAVAVTGIYFRLQSFVFMPVSGLTSGILPIMAYNLGARNKKRITETLKIGYIISSVIMILGKVVFIVFTEDLLSLFNPTKELMDIGIWGLRIMCLSFLPAAIGLVTATFFQATKHGVYSLVMAIVRQLIGILPIAYLLSKLGIGYVWFTFPIAELLSVTSGFIMFAYIYKKQIKDLNRLITDTN